MKNEILDPVRAQYGKPIKVNSGYLAEQGRFDQMILYVDKADSLEPRFIHVSYKRTGINRHRILKKVNGSRQYTPVLIPGLTRNPNDEPRASIFRGILKWTFWIIIAVTALLIVIRILRH